MGHPYGCFSTFPPEKHFRVLAPLPGPTLPNAYASPPHRSLRLEDPKGHVWVYGESVESVGSVLWRLWWISWVRWDFQIMWEMHHDSKNQRILNRHSKRSPTYPCFAYPGGLPKNTPQMMIQEFPNINCWHVLGRFGYVNQGYVGQILRFLG